MNGPASLAEEFRAWALDPARTNDELFTVELLIGQGRTEWGRKHGKPRPYDWDKIRAHKEERRLNPAYRPALHKGELREWLEATVEAWAEVKSLDYSAMDDRPVRDLEALRFFPHLESVSIGGELADLAPLAGLRALKKLSFREPPEHPHFLLRNLDALRGLPALESLTLDLHTPWPDVSALNDLPALRTLAFEGNLFCLREVPSLPQVEEAALSADFQFKTPLRSLHETPEMPAARRLKAEAMDSLEGIERYPRLVNLELSGTYRDLSPLARLPELSFLKLTGEQFSDLAPLARLPRLRELVLARERPLDVSPLAEAPELREVRVERCLILATEVSALNAALTPWSVDFAAEPPRALAPLRFICYSPQHEEMKGWQRGQAWQSARDEKFPPFDKALREAENRWFPPLVKQRLRELLGPDWGKIFPSWAGGSLHIAIRRYRDVARFSEILQALRELSAASRAPWQYSMVIEPQGSPMEELENFLEGQMSGSTEEEGFNAEAEREDWEEYAERRRRRREFLEREHRLKLQVQQGLTINPADFSPHAGQVSKPAVESEVTGENGGEKPDLREEVGFVVTLTEDILWVTSHMKDNAAYLYGEEPEDWHALPMPIEERPEPQ